MDIEKIKSLELISNDTGRGTGLVSMEAIIQLINDGNEIADDTIVEEVRQNLLDRSKTGIKKYGVTLDRKDLNLEDFLNHALEEALDFSLYITKALRILKG